MIKAILCIHDLKGRQYVNPHVAETVEIAIRDFKEEATNEASKSPLARYPQDYELVHVGMFNPQTGEIQSIEKETVFHGKHVGKPKQTEMEIPTTKPQAVS
jgi:hypothetical protein